MSNVTSSARKNLQATAQPPSTHQNPQQTPAVQHIKSSNTTNLSYSMQNLNLDSNNIVFDTDGIPIMRKSESGSASSIESVDDSTPPGTPHTSSGVSSSSSFKKHRVRSDSKSSTSSSKSSGEAPNNRYVLGLIFAAHASHPETIFNNYPHYMLCSKHFSINETPT